MKITLLILLFFSPFALAKEEITDEEFEKYRVELKSHFSQLDGEWVGEIKGLELRGLYPEEPFKSEIILRIEQDSVTVGKKKDGKWYQMPYEFKIVRYKTHAVVYALASGGAWVEGYNFLVTLDDINTMTVLWSRSVSNYTLSNKNKEYRGHFNGISSFIRK
jgi:hypothetical protein